MAYKSLKDRIEEVRGERDRLVTQIADLVENFQSSTGMKVTSINLQQSHINILALPRPQVEIKIEL